MKHLLKPFTGWATDFKTNVFKAARIRLTLYYIFVMVIVVGIFSGMLYVTLEKNIRDSIEENVGDQNVQVETVTATVDRLRITFFVLDGLILLLISALSYVLAGETLQPIVKALDAQKRFSADASHDLRTPLAIMRTDIEVTLNEKHDSSAHLKKTLESNLEEVERMSDLIENLLLLSRLDSGKVSGAAVKFELGDFVQKIVGRFKEQARVKRIALRMDKKDNGSIVGVQSDLGRAFYNILQNALHYTPSRGKIFVEVLKEKDHMSVVIIDNGVGIDKKDLPFVFDRFFKASNSRNEYAGGSGLGLPIAQEIIKAHHGTISLQSHTGKGTRVNISLPLSVMA